MVAHGALDYAELARLGIAPADVCDFSSNINPFGPPEAVRRALSQLDPAPYPDRACIALRQRLADSHGCAPEHILVGNGCNELIYLTSRAMLRPGDRALVVGATYGEYARASELCGAQVCHVGAAGDFALGDAAIGAAVRELRPRLTWVCTPNNPTGARFSPDAAERIAMACADAGGLLVLDRSYAALERPADVVDIDIKNGALALFSLTKSYALAGLRLGYMCGDAVLLAQIAAFQPTWSVSSAAQAAGLAALDDRAFLPRTLPLIWAESDALAAELGSFGLTVWRDRLPMLLVRVGDAAAVRTRLLSQGMLVRDCASFGLPEWVRVAPRLPEENRRLIAAWRSTL
ncbi:histidinol-phosphate aminotransferase family protein [Chloroflexia bacterium SDU3-3]|nr:histidinol-phosphate aminotransferase family protein [Chloroflexia bacterium SDU3-3]